jgi:hypothetical protein
MEKMKLKQGDPLVVDNKMYYFQTILQDGSVVMLSEDGKLHSANMYTVQVVKRDQKENILREFVGYAAENQVAPTDLVNLALKELQ